ncbi:hypothetical protein A2954_04160 [Candidatus Roizmanbacteria bacterium RIFCSPLOWO2_01_FULL_37_12]|uniref:Nucleotidyl transferase domain-containing protein n=1 Tax=Candidatus Roizmanbacteria bacterium RIFCSPLOWO2_01_FULL_37_12 TaxID=1802056 RepID=A0A1F7IFR9_9BACT|nr:MAG: hypothetical protein A3D76_03820 [Candidatus Roizmanbacteria bacterium RIFCSPHIGHO2_02_FULL_37_9b]OGK42180.1 MAG: hypothetical protein A2954_04160 [Candidatus Roizmanbacteria bacterium RIFCSPLOWO2_01_FULL_37_12]
MKIAGIILAGGKGTRIRSHNVNKVSLSFVGKPLIRYGVELFKGIVEPIVVVVGAYSHSVKEVLQNNNVQYAYQKKRLGTGHATKVGLESLNGSLNPYLVLIGYGDHMMFYKKDTVKRLIKSHLLHKAALSLITTVHANPDELAWGRVIRNKNHYIVDNIEQKDATAEERKITELNAGFYCFDYEFLKKNIGKIKKSPVSGEYYINALIHIANEQSKKVVGLKVPFKEVGIGINRLPELQASQNIYIHKRS